MTDREAMQMALEALNLEATNTPIPETAAAMSALRARLAETVSVEPLKWFPSPRKTEWGFGMVCADVEIDRGHTLTLYCEEDQTAKVDAMLSPTRRPLTDEEIDKATTQERDALLDHIYEYETAAEGILCRVRKLARAIDAAHGIKEAE